MAVARVGVWVESEYRAVIAARHLAIAPVELAPKLGNVQAPGEPAGDRLIYSSQRRYAIGQPRGRLLVCFALDKIGKEIGARISFDVGQIGARDRTFGFTRDRRHGRQADDILQQTRAAELAKIEQRGNQDQTVDPDALPCLQLIYDLRPSDAAITFADDEFGRQQATGLFQIAADNDRQRIDVAIDGEEMLLGIAVVRNEAAIAGADRIDEDEVGEVEPGLGVGIQLGRCRWNRALDRQSP